jgi:hypothetical protein
MARDLIASIAGYRSNSYLSVDEADDYFARKYGTTNWFSLSKMDKKALLVQSTKDIDFGNYYGDKYYDAQALQFPRDDHETVSGKCASPNNNRFKHTNLKSDTYMSIPPNYWKYGTVHFTSATLINQIVVIGTSVAASGFIHAPFSQSPTTNTDFIVFAPIDQPIKSAVCEQAHFVLESGLEFYAEARALGIQEMTIGDVSVKPRSNTDRPPIPTNVMCLRSKKLMSRYMRKGLKIARA